jgi:hypothetical protein
LGLAWGWIPGELRTAEAPKEGREVKR